jgi:hypothetical protein
MTQENGSQANSLERAEDLGTDPKAIARRWKLELKLADKREQAWRKKSAEIYKLYTPQEPAANSFNILWSNTETLRQSVYNSLPQPDARRRYQDEDPLGKAVGEVLTRALEFAIDTYDFDATLKGDVLAMLLPGRAVSRVKYMPDIRSEDGTEDTEQIAWEQVICERVQWDDFRMSAGKTWNEVCWIAFRHRFTREDCVEKFGDKIGEAIPLDAVDDEDVKKSKDDGDLFKTAEVWEIWDKDEKEVLFICPTYAEPCKTQGDPLKLKDFWPIPRPLYAIENDQTLVPASLYTQYEQQAKQLNRVSNRINKLTEGLKERYIYDATLTEMAELAKAGDGDMVPAANVTALLERGGLEKAIWSMPIDVAAAVLKELYVQRDQSKQVIYEIMGVADIMRSATDPNETFGAQKIKTQWGTQRLQRMQKEVQRYIRDLIRLKAEIISEKFQPETLEAMTLVNLPHQADVDAKLAQMKAQYQQAAMQAQQQGQQPPPPPQLPPPPITWEKVIEAMRSDATRTYRVDIETDSTLSASQDSDMQGMNDLLGGLAKIMQGFGPAVQEGAMDVSVLKELMLVVTRRAKMGTAIEDVIEKMKQPQPKPDPNAGQMQIEQGKLQATAAENDKQRQHDMQLEQMKVQIEGAKHQRELQAKAQADELAARMSMETEQHKQQMQDAQVQRQNEIEAARDTHQAQLEHERELAKMAFEQQENDAQRAFDKWKTELEVAAQLEIANLSAQTSEKTAAMSAEAKTAADKAVGPESDGGKGLHKEVMSAVTELAGHVAKQSEKIDAIHEHSQAPVTIIRGPDGKATGVNRGGVTKSIKRGSDGRMEGM